MSEKVQTRTKVSLVAIEEELAFSKDAVWAWFYIPPIPYEFKDADSRENVARRIDVALSSLVSSGDKNVESHLIVTDKPFDASTWASKLYQRAEGWNPTPGFPRFLNSMREHVETRDFRVRKVFLGIKLGRRTNSDSLSGPFKMLSGVLEGFMSMSDPQVKEKELEHWRQRSKEIKRTLMAGHLKAVPATPDEIAYLVKKTVYPDMHVPDVTVSPKASWGTGEVRALVESYMEENKKFLKFVQTDENGVDHVGYRATVCFSRFPDVMNFPYQEPWIHFSAVLPFSVDIHSRFTIEPASRVKKDVSRKSKEAQDQAKNAGADAPLEIHEQLQTAVELEYDLSRRREPWIYARHRAVIEAPDEDTLRTRVQQFREHYRDLGIDVVWPPGDQLDLFLESHPADKVRVPSYYQRHGLSIISGGMPMGSGTVGDRVEYQHGRELGWVGPYLGHTTSRVEEIVCLSAHSAIARNNPPGVVITGSPGGGKSFTAFTLTYQMASCGVWTIYIDPKADALPMANLPGLGKAKTFDLRQGNDGLLDPFSIGVDQADKQLLAIETVKLLMGGELNAERETALAEAVKTVSAMPQPSLSKVVDLLYSNNTDPHAKALGSTLDLIRQLPFAKLCFAPQGTVNLRPDEGLTIVTLLGLDLPSADTLQESYTYPNRLAVSVMYLLTSFTRQLMMSLDKSHPKAVIVDEAWAITSTPQGAKMIPEIARMGRSLNTALVLVSQNANDFIGPGITNSLAIKMAFKATSLQEIDGVLDLFNLEKNEGNRETIRTLEKGECLMQDVDGRVSRVQIEAWNQEMKHAFDTNPETRDKEH